MIRKLKYLYSKIYKFCCCIVKFANFPKCKILQNNGLRVSFKLVYGLDVVGIRFYIYFANFANFEFVFLPYYKI